MSMRLKTYVRPECFIHDLAAKTREEALREIVHVVAERGTSRTRRGSSPA